MQARLDSGRTSEENGLDGEGYGPTSLVIHDKRVPLTPTIAAWRGKVGKGAAAPALRKVARQVRYGKPVEI